MVKKLTKWNFLEPFLFEEEEIHLLELSRKLNQNHATVRKYLNDFVKEGFLKTKSKGRLTLFKVNKSFPLIITYLSIAEQEFLIKKCSENMIFKELISELQNKSNKPLIIFGSAVNNFSRAKDIDIISLENLDIDYLEKKYNKKIHLIKVSNLKKINDSLKKEILKKHIIIFGTQEVIKWLN